VREERAVGRRWELFVVAQGEGLDLKRVRAEIRLPERGKGGIRVRLFPQLSVPTAFQMPFEWKLSGEIRDLGGRITTHVEAARVWTEEVSNRTWDVNTTDTTVKAAADELRVTRFLPGERDVSALRGLLFRLSPGPALNSQRIVTYRQNGAVSVRTVHRTAVVL
jgi:hypothetical protein